MGAEFGQWGDWRHDESLPWHLLEFPSHRGVQQLLGDLNRLYRTEPALHELDFEPQGFEWVDANDADASVYAFLRKARSNNDLFLIVFNATPVVRENYRVGVPRGGWWREVLNSDAQEYWGSGVGNSGGVEATPIESHGRNHSVVLRLPPLSALYFKSGS
jgi:1,4-alpha-glucan branching enzyme